MRGIRGAILGEWGGGFNQENGDAAKKSSPQNLWISLLIVFPPSANNACNPCHAPICLFVEHRDRLAFAHYILWVGEHVYVLAFIFVQCHVNSDTRL